MEGWIKLHREIANWRWATSPNHVIVFMQILIRANFKETHWRKEVIMPGQILTGRKQLSAWTGLSEMQIRTVLRDLSSTQEITIKTTKTYSIISISNWDKYQGDNQECNQEITKKQPTDNQHITTSKNANNAKKEKNIIISPLSILFSQDDEIQVWLKTGTEAAQKQLLDNHSHHVLAEEVKKAYLWQLEKKPRKAGTFLVTWMSNKKTSAFTPNQAQKSFSGTHTIEVMSPDEIQILKQAGQI